MISTVAAAAIIALGRFVFASGTPFRVGAVTCQPPARMLPGRVVRVRYDIRAQGSGNVGLGMGLYDVRGNDRSNGGFGDLDRVTVLSGSNPGGRLFKVPRGLPDGSYELDAEVWPAGRIGSESQETLADGTCGTVQLPSGNVRH